MLWWPTVRDVELTKPMRAMIMQMKDAAEEYLEF